MTDPLEQRLRDALRAQAESIGPDDLDRSREAALPPAASAGATRRGWTRLAAAGLAAAAIVVGAVTVSQITGSDPIEQADPLPPASRSTLPESPKATLSAGSGSTTDLDTRTPNPTTDSAPPASPTRRSAPQPSESTAPQPEPTPDPTEPPPTEAAPPASPTETPTTEPPQITRRGAAASATTDINLSVETEPVGDKAVVVRAVASGKAPSSTSSGGVLSFSIGHGDGTQEDRQVRATCEPDQPVRPVSVAETSEHTYSTGGTYVVMVQVKYCAGDGTPTSNVATRTVTVD